MSSLFGGGSQPQIGQDIGHFVAGAGDYGQAIPYVFGCIYVPEFRLWQQSDPQVHSADSGGKGNLFGQPAAGNQNTYSGSVASAFCLGPIPVFGTQVAIRRILGDSTILYDVSEQKTWLTPPETTDQMNARLSSSATFYSQMTMYNGGFFQSADPVMSAAIGGNIPGYQGIVYISMDNVTWPNGRPSGLNAEICQSATLTGTNQIIRQSCAVSTIFTKLLMDCGIPESDIDVSALLFQQVRGIIIPQDGRREAIDNIMRYFDIECCQSGGVIKFFPIDRSISINIPFSDLSASEKDESGNDIEPLEIKDLKETDLPYSIQVSAKNNDNDYVALVQVYTNVIGNSQTSIEYNMGDFSSTSTELIQVTQKQFFRTFAERYNYSFSLANYYNNLEPGDIVTVIDDDNTINTIRLKTVDFGGSDGIVKCSAVRHSVFSSTLIGTPVYSGITLTNAGTTTWVFMNLPPLRDVEASQPGVYIAACGSTAGWLRANLNQSKDGGATWNNVLSISTPAVIGTVNAASGIYSAALPNASAYFIDTTSRIAITLVNHSATLSSVTLAQALGNQNIFLIGNEILIAMTCTLISSGVYGLSNFMRGRRSTESEMAGHVSGETVVQLDGLGVGFLGCNYGDLGRIDQWKMVPNGQTLTDVTAQPYVISGINMMPFSPVNFISSVDLSSGSPDVIFTINRRSRIGQVLTPTTNIPLGETSELYTWRLYTPADILVRTNGSVVPTFTYTHGERNIDFGSPTFDMTGYYFLVAQDSSTMGIGNTTRYTFTGPYS